MRPRSGVSPFEVGPDSEIPPQLSLGKVLLTIGYHELEGAWVDLLKPLVVLRKQTAPAAAAPAGGALPDDDARRPPAASSPDERGRPTASGSTQYVVAGIIRRKLLFKDRPKALISKPAQSSGKWKADHAVAIEVEKDLNGSQALPGQRNLNQDMHLPHVTSRLTTYTLSLRSRKRDYPLYQSVSKAIALLGMAKQVLQQLDVLCGL
eukprot:SM000129S26123  [mRNA]  locus=s129:53908:64300:- [translate_table: standard]